MSTSAKNFSHCIIIVNLFPGSSNADQISEEVLNHLDGQISVNVDLRKHVYLQRSLFPNRGLLSTWLMASGIYLNHISVLFCYWISLNWPPLWSSNRSFWLQIQRFRVRFQIFLEIEGLERGTLSLLRITEELLERTVVAPFYKTEINGLGNSLSWPRDTLSPLKLALTPSTSGGRSVDIGRWRTKPRSSFISLN
jgi:hypothetical protein